MLAAFLQDEVESASTFKSPYPRIPVSLQAVSKEHGKGDQGALNLYKLLYTVT